MVTHTHYINYFILCHKLWFRQQG